DTASAQEDAPGWDELPETFRALVRRSLSLQAVVRRMDEQIYGVEDGDGVGHALAGVNPVFDQINLLETAFGRG
ncbi:MAG TPA: DUF1465 family protein, partial [Thermomicrobiales bacterium]|nr:DUF1465 family protein [Thermomicrobiales bacterium]